MGEHDTLSGWWSEQRGLPRETVDTRAQLQRATGPQLARVRDLSLGGCGVAVEVPPSTGAEVKVTLDLGDLGKIDAVCEVVRVSEVTALRFTQLSLAAMGTLAVYLSRSRHLE